jgi:cytochrome c oxidase subunit 3
MSEHVHHDPQGDRIGMWVFLYSEILLFKGLFVLYSVFLTLYHKDFFHGSHSLNTFVGTLNTVILLISSFAVAASITAVRREDKKGALSFLGVALFCMVLFLINKYFEWGHKIELGIYPNSPLLKSMPHGKEIFYGLYYSVTGLHGLHVIIGGILLAISAWYIKIGKINSKSFVFLENAGLYWHLVDLVWIFVFPLFYLIS